MMGVKINKSTLSLTIFIPSDFHLLQPKKINMLPRLPIPYEIVWECARYCDMGTRRSMRLVCSVWHRALELHPICPIHCSSLWRHCDGGNICAVQFLVERGADLRAKDDWAIVRASERGKFEMIKYLECRGLDICAMHNNPIIATCKGGYCVILEWMVDKGADIKAQFGSPFHTACFYGHLAIVQWLYDREGHLVADSDGNIRNVVVSGEAFAVACGGGSLEVAKWLLGQGSDWNWQRGAANRRAHDYGHENVCTWIREVVAVGE